MNKLNKWPKVRKCDCIHIYHISCLQETMFYCPGCDMIECGAYISGLVPDLDEKLATSGFGIRYVNGCRNMCDFNITEWACLQCGTQVFEINPITFTILKLGFSFPKHHGFKSLGDRQPLWIQLYAEGKD